MTKFNGATKHRVGATSPIRTTGHTSRNPNGGTAYARDPRSELVLLAVTNMVGEKTFYESAHARDNRFGTLIRTVAVEPDAHDFLVRMAAWLRGPANMRSASLVFAIESVRARLDAKIEGNRDIISAVLQRADEPGEMIGYWTANYGRSIPVGVKRGIADAVQRLYSERSLLKYDTSSHTYRFADVIRLTHPVPKADWQDDLFQYAIARRWAPDAPIPDSLEMLRHNRELHEFTPTEIMTAAAGGGLAPILTEAGLTWEAIPALVNGPWTKELWEAVIPSMGYMALLRNLRNFDKADVSDKVADMVSAKLADPEEVAKSRQLPMRFLSAYNATENLRWSYPLEKALDLSLANVPALSGRTLILVDTSTSMDAGFSKDGSLHRWDAAAMFGLALGRRCDNADVVSFSSARQYLHQDPGARTLVFPMSKGGSLLSQIKRWKSDGFFLGGGTDTAAALVKHFAGHDRVVIITDEMAERGDPGSCIPATTPMFTWNLAGYSGGHAPSGTAHRHAFGGLTDQGFQMIPLLERGLSQGFPF